MIINSLIDLVNYEIAKINNFGFCHFGTKALTTKSELFYCRILLPRLFEELFLTTRPPTR